MLLRPALFAVVAGSLVLSGCADTQAVADFGDEAAKTAAQGPPIFGDLADSCDARHRINENVRAEWEKPAAPEAEPAPCARLRTQAETARVDSLALRKYFQSVRALALGREPADDGDSGGGASSGAVGQDLAVAADLNKLAGQLVAERYQQSHLIGVLKQADSDVAAIINALLAIVNGFYQPALKNERADIDLAYLGFGKTDAKNNPALLFLLNRGYRDDMASLDRRRHAAEAYAAGLEKTRDAHHKLAADAASHEFKKLYAEAKDYASQLQQLIQDVQAAR